jgi:hypothetical protein
MGIVNHGWQGASSTTRVSVPIKEDKPSDQELFGAFYDPALEEGDFTSEDMASAC